MDKPLLLDTFCKAGGCTRGYQLAGFDVVGCDIEPQKHYIGSDFYLGDALDLLRRLNGGEAVTFQSGRAYRLDDFAVIHASPPCQGYSRLRHLPWLKDREYPRLIDGVRTLLELSGRPWIVENVEDAPLDGLVLCGLMFGLNVYRHRKFETSVFLLCPGHPKHLEVIGHGRMVNDRRKGTLSASSAKGAWGNQKIITVAGGQFSKRDGERALQIDWMTKYELAQAIPPAYTHWLGDQLRAALGI